MVKPRDHAFRQQRMKGWQPILDPVWTIAFMLLVGVVFIPTGFFLVQKSNEIVELVLEYDHHDKSPNDLPCGIGRQANANKTCILPSFTAPKDMEPPILIYYQLTNFYQNHFTFVESRDELQLAGQPLSEQSSTAIRNCEPLNKLGNKTLNPCGLFANTFFNDIIQLVDSTDLETGEVLQMQEEGIAWKSELEYRFLQPQGFHYSQCASCDDCSCDGDEWSCKEPWRDPKDGLCYRYFYPDDENVQYLYEVSFSFLRLQPLASSYSHQSR